MPLTESQKAENESVWACPRRAVSSYKNVYDDWSGETAEELVTENHCNDWKTTGIKSDKCNKCGKTFHYP